MQINPIGADRQPVPPPAAKQDLVAAAGGETDIFSKGAGATAPPEMKQMAETTGVRQVEAATGLWPREKWVAQARHVTDFFAHVSVDREQGGFFTHIDSQGNVPNPDEKFLMPTSRQVWAYSAAYEMTGDRKYLDLAKHGVDFILRHHMQRHANGEVSWFQRVNRDGSLPEGEVSKPWVINEQTYGLAGLIEYYKVTKDPKILDIIRSGHKFITNHFADRRNGGFFDSVDSGTREPVRTKSYNSTVYPATSALLEMADIAQGEWKKEVLAQVKDLADLFVSHFPDDGTGFIKENFTSDWREDWRGWQRQPEGTIGVTGHNTQGALFLLRAQRLLQREGMLSPDESSAYRDTAKKVVDSILERGYDKERGGWYDVFVRETGKNMWHNNKAFWQQEEGYLATLAMSRLDGDPKYREASAKTLEFWDRFFIDREIGGDRMTVAADGTPVADPKGGPGKSSYHSTELATLAM
jgi:mannose/cellobiose epimerase-like protein (N-acyl-D-glucosamine 2-epimerase family)